MKGTPLEPPPIGATIEFFTILGPPTAGGRGGKRTVPVRCICGTEKHVALVHVLKRTIVSCGCYGRAATRIRNATHGATRGAAATPEYVSWGKMIGRCHNERNAAYADYGGRGIRVCSRWRADFAAFLADVGPRPSGEHSIDRYPNNDGHYEPGNVRWATAREQNRNRRDNRVITHEGVARPLAAWAEQIGLTSGTLWARLRAGWTVDRALTTPLDPRRRAIGDRR